MVKDYTISTFGLFANITRRDHWRVNRPDIEIDPWADHAATLINSLPVQYAEAIGKYSAAWAVALGLGGMIYFRMKLDAELSGKEKRHKQPVPNPDGQRLITDDDIRATGGSPVEDVVIPTVEGVTISQDNLMKIWEYQRGGPEQPHEMTATNHRFGKGGADPLTPRDLRGILG